MSRTNAFAHILPRDDGPSTGFWGAYILKSAFQPIFAFVDGRLAVEAFEGLIRPFRDGEVVSPAEFFRSIPAGERLLVETLTRTLHLLNAGRYLDPESLLFVNFDPSVFSDRATAELALREMRLTLHEAAIEPDRIVCEVTEQKAVTPQALTSLVSALRHDGFRIAVDDYGAEDSDMDRVSALEPDIVKFDAQWLSRLMDTPPGVALLSVMVEEFASRGIKTVFEGIEEDWQLALAEKSGAHMVQGYALARPELAPTSFAMFARHVDALEPPRSVAVDAIEAERAVFGGHAAARPFGRRAPS